MNIALFFGSFNPIHHGHLMVAQAVLNQSECQELWFVVSPQNPFKKQASLLHAFDRLDMVERAIADHFQFKSCDLELHLPQPSYTVHTLYQLRERYPQHHFSLVMGGDNLEHFHQWKNYEDILEHHEILVYPRGEQAKSSLWEHPKVQRIQAPFVHLSSTYVRDCIRQGQSIRYLVPEALAQFIEAKKFYL